MIIICIVNNSNCIRIKRFLERFHVNFQTLVIRLAANRSANALWRSVFAPRRPMYAFSLQSTRKPTTKFQIPSYKMARS